MKTPKSILTVLCVALAIVIGFFLSKIFFSAKYYEVNSSTAITIRSIDRLYVPKNATVNYKQNNDHRIDVSIKKKCHFSSCVTSSEAHTQSAQLGCAYMTKDRDLYVSTVGEIWLLPDGCKYSVELVITVPAGIDLHVDNRLSMYSAKADNGIRSFLSEADRYSEGKINVLGPWIRCVEK